MKICNPVAAIKMSTMRLILHQQKACWQCLCDTVTAHAAPLLHTHTISTHIHTHTHTISTQKWCNQMSGELEAAVWTVADNLCMPVA